MTWMFKRKEGEPLPPIEGNTPSPVEQFWGGAKAVWIAQDSWWRQERLRSDFEDEIIARLGGEDAIAPETPPEEERFYRGGANARRDYLLEKIAAARAVDPAKVGDAPGSPDEWDAALKRRDEEEEASNAEMLGRGHNRLAKMAGGMFGAVADETSIPLAFVGGAPLKLARFVAIEAGMGALSEVPAIAKENARDERLGRPGVSMGEGLTRMAVSGVASGAIAGVIGGAARALEYSRVRRLGEAALRGERAGALHEADICASERALRTGREPPPPTLYRPDVTLAAEDDPAVDNLLRLIGKVEAPKGFDQVSSYAVVEPPKPLTQMTINEVMAWQASNTAAGGKSHAAGRFQIMRPTLGEMRDRLKLTGNELFDAAMQKRLAVELMRVEGLEDWRAGRMSDAEFGNRLANRWAALPRVSGDGAGASVYAGDGLNAAGTNVDTLLAVLRGEEVPDVVPPGGTGFTGRGRAAVGSLEDLAAAETGRLPGAPRATATAIDLGGPVDLPRFDASPLVETAARREAARAADPEAFARLDAAEARRAELIAQLEASSASSRVGQPRDAEVEHLLGEIDTREASLRQQLVETRTAGKRMIREQLKQIPTERARVMEMSGQRETPEVFRLRRQLLTQDAAIQALEPRVAKAFAVADARPRPALPMPEALRPPKSAPKSAPPSRPMADFAAFDASRLTEGAASAEAERADAALAETFGMSARDRAAGSDVRPSSNEAPGRAANEFGDLDRTVVRIPETGEVISLRDLVEDLDADDALIRSMTSCALKGVPA